MPSKATISVGEKFLYDFKTGPAGGRLRRPSSAGRLTVQCSSDRRTSSPSRISEQLALIDTSA